MEGNDKSFQQFLQDDDCIIKIKLIDVVGSAPRNVGTKMYVSKSNLWGSVGGGQLEYILIKRAFNMLEAGLEFDSVNIPLGPEIGQCCGGRVKASLKKMNQETKQNTLINMQHENTKLPHVYIMGAGHVGRALAQQLEYMPVKCILIDTRVDEIAKSNAQVEKRLSAFPEIDIKNAPPGSAFVILTHDHSLDFLLTAAALDRDDTSYIGMIGSATKRTKFVRWCDAHHNIQNVQNLVCPIGANGSSDKRPSVIAAFITAEIISELTHKNESEKNEKSFNLRLIVN